MSHGHDPAGPGAHFVNYQGHRRVVHDGVGKDTRGETHYHKEAEKFKTHMGEYNQLMSEYFALQDRYVHAADRHREAERIHHEDAHRSDCLFEEALQRQHYRDSHQHLLTGHGHHSHNIHGHHGHGHAHGHGHHHAITAPAHSHLAILPPTHCAPMSYIADSVCAPAPSVCAPTSMCAPMAASHCAPTFNAHAASYCPPTMTGHNMVMH